MFSCSSNYTPLIISTTGIVKMTNRKITNPLSLIKSVFTHNKRQKKYIANLEAALIDFRFKEQTGLMPSNNGLLHKFSVN